MLQHSPTGEAQGGLAPGRIEVAVEGLYESIHAAALQPVRQPVPAGQGLLVDEPHVHRPDHHQAGQHLAVVEGVGDRRVRPHRVAAEDERRAHLGVEHRLEVADQLRIGVAAACGSRVRGAVAAGVV